MPRRPDQKERECDRCGTVFTKRERDSSEQWRGRRYCGKACSNKQNGDDRMRPLEERYWEKVITFKEGCWKWGGVTDNHGYGTISKGRQTEGRVKAHRISWELHFGPIPTGLNVLHACDNPVCTNPDHLMIGTQRANAVDAARKGRLNLKSLENLTNGKR